MKLLRKLNGRIEKQEKSIRRQTKHFNEQLQQHVDIQKKVASLEVVQSHQIAGETLYILLNNKVTIFIVL